MNLPIDSHLEKINNLILNHPVVILKASPGSGKTTRIPPFISQNIQKKIFVLEPRRLAAKMSAERIAEESKTELGNFVGYSFRFEKVFSKNTKIIFQTEGTFLKHLLNDPYLDQVDLVILDEFHERHLETDIALAYLDYLQRTKRPDLKLVIMSATLDIQKLQNYFPDAPTYEVISPPFPLVTHHLENKPSVLGLSLEKKILLALDEILPLKGDVLIFLSGKKEIDLIYQMLEKNLRGNFLLLKLHGQLTKEEQNQVMKSTDERKIILSTNVAESSITIPGVRNVIDSGEHKEIEFSYFSGLTSLKTTKISKSSAIQRAGRANRQGPGVVFKLYSAFDEDNRIESQKAEILRTDLSQTVLDLLTVGIKMFDPQNEVKFLEIPTGQSIYSAKKLLTQLGAVDSSGLLTDLGRNLNRLPLNPRQSKIVIESQAKYLNEAISFVLQNEKKTEKDYLSFRIREYLKSLIPKENNKNFEQILLEANVDRILKARKQNRDFLSTNGEILKLAKNAGEIDFSHDFWVGLEFSPNQEVTNIIPIEESWLYEIEPFPIEEKTDLAIDSNGFIQVYEKLYIGSLNISENKTKLTIPNKNSFGFMRGVLASFYNQFTLNESFNRFIFFEQFTKRKTLELPLEDWLNEWAERLCSFTIEDQKNFQSFLEIQIPTFLDPDGTSPIQEFAPQEISLTDKRKVPIHYRKNSIPFVESYIQDFYGLKQTPQIAQGKVHLKVHLLGPHKRALQVTSDLMSFWNGAYKEMHKELSRDYPRHYWPMNPKDSKPILLKKNA
jgi:ATP-dependent helicase HrpB